jgi:hypothetical protein
MQEMKLKTEESGFNINSWSQLRQGLMLGTAKSVFFILVSWSLLCQVMMLGDVESGFTMIHRDS